MSESDSLEEDYKELRRVLRRWVVSVRERWGDERLHHYPNYQLYSDKELFAERYPTSWQRKELIQYIDTNLQNIRQQYDKMLGELDGDPPNTDDNKNTGFER